MTVALTLLDLGDIILPIGSKRGIQQKLEPIAAAVQVRRTINGVLVNVGEDQFKKYRSSITCSDQAPPSWDGIWPGDIITVRCAAELSYPTTGGSPDRDVVTDSTRTEGDYTFYRPELTMMVVGKTQQFDEWQGKTVWALELEEV